MKTRFPSRQINADDSAALRLEHAEPARAGPPPRLRFLAGVDRRVVAMPAVDGASGTDAFSAGVLGRGTNPLTLRDLVTAIAGIPAPGDLPVRKMFVVAEGGQHVARHPSFEFNARLVFTWQQSDARPPDILLSTVAAADDPDSLLQLIAWSGDDGAFHFFERKSGQWVWAGNSFHALVPPTRGQGPFDSHINGGLVMKELKAPWGHWHSMSGSIAREAFGAGSEFNTDPLFSALEGADVLENIVRAGVRRWTKGRLARDLRGGTLANLPQYARQILWCTSVNVASASIAVDNPTATELDLPTSFFFDLEAIEFLASSLDPTADVIPLTRFGVDIARYRAAITAQGIGVQDDARPPHRVPGDTPFPFMVPERAFEDLAVVVELVSKGVLSPRLGLCLLLVDFSNPVFSPERASLLRHFPDTVAAGAGGQALDRLVLGAVRAAASTGDSAEARLLVLWEDPDLLGTARTLLAEYHRAVSARLGTAEGVMDLVALADSRREAVRSTRQLFEFKATMARGAAPMLHLAMRPDATLFVKSTTEGEGEL